MSRLFERLIRGEQISWLYRVWEFEQEGLAKIVSRTYMRTEYGKNMIKRSRFWGCKRG